jgi:hypothetical protein
MNCFIKVVVTGATGIVTKRLKYIGRNTRKAVNRSFTKSSTITSRKVSNLLSATRRAVVFVAERADFVFGNVNNKPSLCPFLE